MRIIALVGCVACRSMAMRPELSRATVSKRITAIGDLVPKISGPGGSLAALKAASAEVSSILAEAGGPADDHISDDDAALLRQVVDLVENTIYGSMDASHSADEAALAAAVDAAAACNADIRRRQSRKGDLGILHQHVQDKQTELDRLQRVVDDKTEANNTKWADFDSHMQMIADAPACPDFPARTMPALDVYFEKSEYSIWFSAQQASYDAMRDAFSRADAALTSAIRAYNIKKASRDVQYCDWKRELEAACAAFDKCFADATSFFRRVLVPRVRSDMASRIEVKKAGDTLIHQINFLLGTAVNQETPPIDVSRYQITFPSLPAKGQCDLSQLDADEWVPTVTCDDVAAPKRPDVVEVPNLGVLEGSIVEEDVAYFKGIPYAMPPTGTRRWQPPESHGPWASPRDATKFGAPCPQRRGEDWSEDCLFLNVATPVDALQEGSSPLPVMIWIHGGNMQSGNSADYAAEKLVAASNKQVVVVAFNYRLNVFGFLASAEVQASSSDSSMNFGIQDQRMAMAWVQDHIAAFGGDSASVTIFGESAGGNSVMNHLVRPASFPYFTKAIIQSGTYDEGVTRADSQARYEKMLELTACADLACLHSMDATTILGILSETPGSAGPGPVVDGVDLTDTPARLMEQGKHKKVPILIGATRDEYLSSLWGFDFTVSSEAEFDASFETKPWLNPVVNSSNLGEVKALYDPSVYPYPADLGKYSIWTWMLGRVATDQVPGLGACGVRWIAKYLLDGGTPSLHTYSFDFPPRNFGPASVFAGHTVEIPFVFGTQTRDQEASDLALSMARHWVAFASTGNPNLPGQDVWPAFTAEDEADLHFDVASNGGIRMEKNRRIDACQYFQALAGYSDAAVNL